MANGTGENEMGLQKISGLIRNLSAIILFLHYYYYCYRAFVIWNLHWNLIDRIILNLAKTGLFNNNYSKLICLGLLILSLVGSKGRRDEKFNWKPITIYLFVGLV